MTLGSSHGRRWRPARPAALAAIATLLALAGCAPLPAAPAGAPVPPAPAPSGTPVPAPAPGHVPPAGAARDSTPSADAVRVLATIPEPLAPSQQVPPPERAPGTVSAPAPEAAFDTLRAGRASAEDSVVVPVPQPTQPLGRSPGATLLVADTLFLPPASPPPAANPATPPATTPGTAAGPEPCWRLQVAAPVEKAQAESRREAAQSLLVVPMAIRLEKGLYKVRTRDCMSREAADALRQRAADSGFDGAFVVNTSAAAAAPTRPKPATSTSRKKKPR